MIVVTEVVHGSSCRKRKRKRKCRISVRVRKITWFIQAAGPHKRHDDEYDKLLSLHRTRGKVSTAVMTEETVSRHRRGREDRERVSKSDLRALKITVSLSRGALEGDLGFRWTLLMVSVCCQWD